MKNYVLLMTMFCIYSLTFLTHYFLTFLEHGRAFLGVTMIIPLLSVIIVQKIFTQLPILSTFSFTKPKWSWLLASIFTPFSLGVLVHSYFYLTHYQSFLIITPSQLSMLLLIGLTISTGSALLEEVVWRGNFHVYLRQRYSFWQTAIFTGVGWSLWHLPIAVLYKPYVMPAVGIPTYLLLLFGLSIVLSIIREVGQSIVPVAIFHGMMNVFYLGDGQNMTVSPDNQEIVKCLVIILFLFLFCRKNVTIFKNQKI